MAIGALVCPHCGNEQEDTDFCGEGRYEGEEECGSCEGRYRFVASITVDWQTKKVE